MWILNILKIGPLALNFISSPKIKKFWKENNIMILICIILIMILFYLFKINNYEEEITHLDSQLQQEKLNYKQIKNELIKNNDIILKLNNKKITLEKNIKIANESIIDLRKKNSIIIKDVYSQDIPSSCSEKFKWMRKEILKNK